MFPETKANPQSLVRSQLTDKIELKVDGEAKPKFIALGVPYGGPSYLDGKDFHGERFVPETDFGDTTGVTKVYATLDHAVSIEENGKTIISPVKMFIGSAEFLKSDDFGRWYEISVSEGDHYNDVIELLKDLESKKMLRASSQAIPTSVVKDVDGTIKSWVVSEIAFTTHAANPLAVVEVMKNHSFDTAQLEAFIKTAQEVQLENSEEASEENVDEESEVPFDEYVEDLLSNEDSEESSEENVEEGESEAKNTEEVTLVDRLENVEKILKSLQENSKLWAYMDASIGFSEEDLPKIFQLLTDLSNQVKTITETNKTLEKGLRNFAEVTSKQLGIKVEKRAQEISKQSKTEAQAEAQAMDDQIKNWMKENNIFQGKASSVDDIFPDNAPGGK